MFKKKIIMKGEELIRKNEIYELSDLLDKHFKFIQEPIRHEIIRKVKKLRDAGNSNPKMIEAAVEYWRVLGKCRCVSNSVPVIIFLAMVLGFFAYYFIEIF